MLGELYRYALQHDLTARAGYKERRVKAYVSFLSGGGEPSLIPAVKPLTFAPDLGSKANGTTKCNPLVEKALYVLNICDPNDPKDQNNPVKHRFYLSMLESAAVYEPLLALCHTALQNEETLATLRAALKNAGLHDNDPIGLMVDGFAMEKSERLYDWWAEFRAGFDDTPRAAMRCLITGKPSAPLPTVPKVPGLRSVGGHSSGDALLCFDKDAFTSYGFEQGENACVSEEAMTAVNAALSALIAQAPRLAGAKYVYFFKEPVAAEEDPLPLVFGSFFEAEPAPDESIPDGSTEPDANGEPTLAGETAVPAFSEESPAEDPIENPLSIDQRQREDAARLAAKALLESIQAGQRPELLANRYSIMPLSGANGRIMVRGWMEGDFASLCKNVQVWFDDLRLVTPYGQGYTRTPKLFALCTRLLKPQKGSQKIGERMDDELSVIVPRMVYAIINQTSLPDTVASRALAHIRSSLLAATDGNSQRERTLDTLACELLKAWLNRMIRRKGGTETMEQELNPSYQGIAYQLGRLMAVYAAIQAEALGSDLGAGVLQRYYASASTSPALVIGKLANLSQYHLSKLSGAGGTGKVIWYTKALQEIYGNIRQSIPTTLSLMQQSEFALGYYQQRATLFKPRASQPDAPQPDETETQPQE